MIRKLHHAAYRCRDSEETRAFYEEFLGLPLVNAFEITETKSGRATHVLHSFYAMDDGSCVAFFEDPATPFEFKAQRDYDLHIALEVPHDQLQPMLDKGKRAGIETRGIADHDGIHSIYFRDPNGYVVELTAKSPHHDAYMDPGKNAARAHLAAWQRDKASYT
ncbi:MAG TPA: VOC family protein [Kofleriaceae bacterium]|nr:VOC family protein [Kofleriaceae bacterium]